MVLRLGRDRDDGGQPLLTAANRKRQVLQRRTSAFPSVSDVQCDIETPFYPDGDLGASIKTVASNRLSTKAKWALGGLLGLFLVFAGAGGAYAAHFSNVALPGVTVGGHSVTGMTQEQISALVTELAEETTLTVSVEDKEMTSSLEDMGLSVDANTTAQAALEPSHSVPTRFAALFGARDIPVAYQSDQAVMDETVAEIAALADPPVQEATVVVAETGDYFVSTESSPGAGVDTKLVEETALLAVQTLEAMDLELESTLVEPVVSTEEAQEVAALANDLLQTEVVLKGTTSVNPASVQDRVAWVTIPVSEEGLSDPSFDPERIKDWVAETAKSTEDDPVDGIQNVDASGKVVETPDPGTPGWAVSNLDEITSAVVDAVTKGESFEGTFTYTEVTPGFEQRDVLPGSENLVYSPHAGQRWVDINLTNHTVSAYEGTDLVRGPIPMVDGTDQTPTVTGTYRIYMKYDKQTMRGFNVDGSRYETPDVPWAAYFYEGYAFHGAYWRSTFGHAGPSGSHGCVNMPVDEAKWLYDFADIGTTVVSHY